MEQASAVGGDLVGALLSAQAQAHASLLTPPVGQLAHPAWLARRGCATRYAANDQLTSHLRRLLGPRAEAS